MKSEEIWSDISQNSKWVKDIILKLDPDLHNGPVLMNLLDKDQPETRGLIAWAAKRLQPKNYLEIGTRRGWSAAMVAMSSPNTQLYCCDMWHQNYSNSPNPGPSFVTSELKKLGYEKPINFLSGDSLEVIPKFFKENPNLEFDLILVDGDHLEIPATKDLDNTMPHVSVGGMLVFDDIVGEPQLDHVFGALIKRYPNFEYHAFRGNYPGIALAIRKS